MSEGRSRPPRPRLSLSLKELRGTTGSAYAIRFAFGAAVSAAAALITAAWGARIGGIFLAFPAILPASLTLIERQRGTAAAGADAKGAELGGLGLIAFGLIAWKLLPRMAPPLGLLLATAAWAVVAIGGYLCLRHLLPDDWGLDEA
ncbi:MAG TPA: DUF3147 family protein [Candidatus Dormibacteraeota bacterium]